MDILNLDPEGQPINNTTPESTDSPASTFLGLDPVIGEAWKHNMAMQTAIINAGTKGTNPIEEYHAIKDTPDLETRYKSSVWDKQQSDIGAVDKWLSGEFQKNPTELPQQVQQHSLMKTEIENEHTGPLAKEQAVTDQLSSNTEQFDIKRERDKKAQVSLAIENSITELVNASGGTFLTTAPELILNDFLLWGIPQDLIEAETIKGATGKTGILLDRPENLADFIKRFHALSPERQQIVLPAIKELAHNAAVRYSTIIPGTMPNYEEIKFLTTLLDPTLGEDTKFYAQLNNWTLGLAGAIGGISAATRATKAVNAILAANREKNTAIGIATQVGNVEGAAKIAATTLTDETGKVAKAVGTTKEDSAIKASGFRISADISADPEFEKKVADLSPKIREQVIDFYKQSADVVEAVRADLAALKEPLLTESERIEAAQKSLDKFVGQIVDHYNLKPDADLVNYKYTNVTDMGATMEVEFRMPGNGTTPTFKKNVIWTVDDVTGKFDITELSANPILAQVASPNQKYASSKTAIEIAHRYERAAEEVNTPKKLLHELLKSAQKIPLNSKASAKIDKVLLAGDEYIHPQTGVRGGNVWSVPELTNGVTTPFGTVRLTTPAEIETYYNRIALNKHIYELANYEHYRKLQIKGFKVHSFGQEEHLVKPIEEASTAKGMITRGEMKRIYDPDIRLIRELTTEEVEAQYKLGKQVVHLAEPLRIEGQTERAVYALVKKASRKNVPFQVLKERTGWVSQLSRGTEFWVKEKRIFSANGKEIEEWVAVSSTSNKKDAADIVQELQKANPNKVYEVRVDRESSISMYTGDERVSGGTIFGHRAEKPIPFGRAGVRAERMSALESIDRTLNVISNMVTKTELNAATEKKLINTLQGMGLDVRSMNDINLPITNATSKKIMDFKSQIQHWNGIPTHEESVWEGAVQHLHDWMLTGARLVNPSKEAVFSLLSLKHLDPVRAARAATFKLSVAWARPDAYLVQAGQSAVVASLYPTLYPKILKLTAQLTTAQISENTLHQAALLTKLAESGEGVETMSEIKQLLHHWTKSGMRFSYRQHETIDQYYTGVGLTIGRVTKLLNSAEAPYLFGVDFANKNAFIANMLKWKEKTGKSWSAISDSELREILNLTNRDLFHMNNAMRARVHEGLPGLVLQFTNIMFKSTEALIGKEYTKAEKFRIIAGQLALFGSVGVPLGAKLVDRYMREHGVEPSQLSENDRKRYKFVRDGMFGGILLAGFGIDSDMSSRMSLIGGMGESITSLVFSDQPLIAKIPASNVGNRAWDMFTRLGQLSASVYRSGEVTWGDLLNAAHEIADLPSATRNINKAIFMQEHGQIKDKHGNIIVEKDFTKSEIIGQALGMTPSLVRESFELNKFNISEQDKLEAKADTYLYWMSRNADKFDGPVDPEFDRKMNGIMAVLVQNMTPPQFSRFLDILNRRITQPKNSYDKAVSKFFRNQAPTRLMEELVNTFEELNKEVPNGE